MVVSSLLLCGERGKWNMSWRLLNQAILREYLDMGCEIRELPPYLSPGQTGKYPHGTVLPYDKDRYENGSPTYLAVNPPQQLTLWSEK
jgi:hypothetical protein